MVQWPSPTIPSNMPCHWYIWYSSLYNWHVPRMWETGKVPKRVYKCVLMPSVAHLKLCSHTYCLMTTADGVPHPDRQFHSYQLLDTPLQSPLKRLVPVYTGFLGDLTAGHVCTASRTLGTEFQWSHGWTRAHGDSARCLGSFTRLPLTSLHFHIPIADP